jgi:hypothetical protein
MKSRLPGDSYKLWVDLASLIYDRLYHVGPLTGAAYDERGLKLLSLDDTTLLLAVGESGKRTYGGGIRILPDTRNVCLIRQMPLLRKIALKGLFARGAHTGAKEATLFSASRLEFTCQHPILAQMDGETVLLSPADFPVSIALTAPVIPILKSAGNTL